MNLPIKFTWNSKKKNIYINKNTKKSTKWTCEKEWKPFDWGFSFINKRMESVFNACVDVPHSTVVHNLLYANHRAFGPPQTCTEFTDSRLHEFGCRVGIYIYGAGGSPAASRHVYKISLRWTCYVIVFGRSIPPFAHTNKNNTNVMRINPVRQTRSTYREDYRKL